MKMDQRKSSGVVLNRSARILAIAFTIFIGLFALDVFEPGKPLGEIPLALAIHLIPTYLVLIFLWIAWKRPQIGGVLFVLAGTAYITLTGVRNLSAILLIGVIPMFIGFLFMAGYFLQKDNLENQ